MTLEVAGISLKVDSTDAVTAKANLDKMAAAGATSAAAFSQVEAGARTAGAALAGTAAAAAAGSKGIASTASGAKGAADALKATGTQAKLTGNQTAQLSAQLQDLFVQVQAGGSPLTALIQQGSQLSAVFGGVAPALRAVGTVLFSTAAAYAALAAAGVGIGAAFVIGQQQSADLQRALILSGNAAGVTEGQFNSMAKAIAEGTKTTIGSTRDTLQDLVGSGRISGEVLSTAATAVQLLAKITGQASSEIAKKFADAADAPAKFAEETNRSYNFLNASQLAYIRRLDEQGRGQEALAQTFALLIPRLEEAANKTTGLGAALQAAKNEASAFVDAMASIGREAGPEERIKAIRYQLDELARAGQKGYVFGPSAADLQAQLNAEERTADARRKDAAAQGLKIQKDQAGVEFGKLVIANLTQEEQRLKALADARTKAADAGASQKDLGSVLAGINRRFDNGQNKARLGFDIEQIRAQEEQRLTIYRQSEGVLEALRQAGAVVDREYYDAKRAFVELDRLTQEGALNAEIARLQQFKGTATEQLEVRKQIAQAQAKLSEVQAGAATKAVILNIQEATSVKALEAAYIAQEMAAAAALRQAQRSGSQRASDVGLGDKEREQNAALESVAAAFTQRQVQLEQDRVRGKYAGREAEYARDLTLLEKSEADQLAAMEAGFAKRSAAEAKWQNGASAALANYRDQALNTAGQVQAAMENASKGMEDALVNFVTTGKLNFNDLAASIISDITRIIVKQQIVAPLMQALGGGGEGGMLGGLFSGLFGGGRATGGPVSAGKLYEVNETGRSELLNVGGRQYLMAGQNGSVTPSAGAAGGMSQVNHFHISGPVDRRTQQQIATAAGRGAQQAMARNG